MCMRMYLCKMDTEGVTLFKESPRRLLEKQKEVKEEGWEEKVNGRIKF